MEGALGPLEAPVGDGPDLDDDPSVPPGTAEDHAAESAVGASKLVRARLVRVSRHANNQAFALVSAAIVQRAP